MKTNITLLLLILLAAQSFAQISSGDTFIKNLTTWVNPKKDSIKTLKLKDITTYEIRGNDIKIYRKTVYNQDGYLLTHNSYSFKYDEQNNLTEIKFPSSIRKFAADGVTILENAPDSIAINNNSDSINIFYALAQFNNVFYKKMRRHVSKNGKGIDEEVNFNDTLLSCKGKIIRHNSKSNNKYDCNISSLILPTLSYNKNGYKETYKYDFRNQPPDIEYIQEDTMGKFKRTYYFISTKEEGDSLPFSSYILSNVHTEKKGNEFNEDIGEYYYDIARNKSSKYPHFIIQSKQFSDRTEIYEYKGKSAKSKKLTSFYTYKTEYTYFK